MFLTLKNSQYDLYLRVFKINIGSGNDLSFREATLRVLSAMKVFTTVFGMGTGGVLSLCHQKTCSKNCNLNYSFKTVFYAVH